MDLDHERSSMVQILRGDLAMERLSAATTRRLPRTSDCRFLGDLGPVFLPGPQRSSPTSDRLIGVQPSTPPWSTRAIQWKAIFHLPGTGTGTGTLTGGPEMQGQTLASEGHRAAARDVDAAPTRFWLGHHDTRAAGIRNFGSVDRDLLQPIAGIVEDAGGHRRSLR